MKVTVKLYAFLGEYLPAVLTERNVAEIDVPEGAGISVVLEGLGVPAAMCHLVLVNGEYVAPGDRDSTVMEQGDALAVWPPVAGG